MDFSMLNLLLRYGVEFRHGHVRDRGLTETECLLCRWVHTHADCTQDDAVRGLRMDKTTAAKALQALENKGFILRVPDGSDRRKKRLRLTEAGAANISSIIDLHDKWMEKVLSCLTEDERKQFEEYCGRLLCSAEDMLTEGDQFKGDGK